MSAGVKEEPEVGASDKAVVQVHKSHGLEESLVLIYLNIFIRKNILNLFLQNKIYKSNYTNIR